MFPENIEKQNDLLPAKSRLRTLRKTLGEPEKTKPSLADQFIKIAEDYLREANEDREEREKATKDLLDALESVKRELLPLIEYEKWRDSSELSET